MKKSSSFALLFFSVILILLTLTCSMDLEPAKSGNTTLSISIGAPNSQTPDASRAVAPDYGYLYIRTVGGPTGNNGPFYGPYSITNGTTFTTTDIPAGSYTGIAFMYATEDFEERSIHYNEEMTTFRQLMTLSDEEFIAITSSISQKDPIGELVNGYASTAIIKDVRIRENQVNTVNVTLIPNCKDESIKLDTGSYLYRETGDSNKTIRKFIEINRIKAPEGQIVTNVTCTINPPNGALYIGRVQFFDKLGKLVKNFSATGQVNEQTIFDVPWAGGDTGYLYIEYKSAQLDLVFNTSFGAGAAAVAPVTLVINGLQNGSGQKVFAMITPDEYSAPVAYAVFSLDASGSGSAKLLELGTKKPYEFTSGTCGIGFFVDINNNYGDLLSGSQLSSFIGIEQHYGDSIYYDDTLVADGTAKTHVCENFKVKPSKTYLYYLDQSGSGFGQRKVDPIGFAQFMTQVGELNLNTGENIRGCLTETITYNTVIPINANKDVKLTSLVGARKTILLTASSNVNIPNGGKLRLSNLIIEGSTGRSVPLIDVTGYLTMEAGAVLQNNANSTGPGGVQINTGGSFTMEDGSITGCSSTYGVGGVELNDGTFIMNGGTITNCSSQIGSSGGGVSLTHGSFTMNGGTITNCSSNVSGGGVSVSFGTFTMNGGIITSCTANSTGGGGVAVKSYGIFNMIGGIITYCSSGMGSGGGVFVDSTGTFTLNGGTIDTCYSENASGGGVYAKGLGLVATFNFTSGNIINCSATKGNGGGLYLGSEVAFSVTASAITISGCTAERGGGIAYHLSNYTVDEGTLTPYVINNMASIDPLTNNFYKFN